MGGTFPPLARRRRAGVVLWAMPVVVAAAVAVAVLPQILDRGMPDAPPLGQIWMATPRTIRLLSGDDPKLTRLFFDRPTSYALSGGWERATPALAWASSTRFEVALAQSKIPADVHTVMYDPESWSFTPIWERRHPEEAMRLFSDAAHHAGYRVVLTPHPGLVEVSGADCHRETGESTAAAFLRCGIIGEAARLGDVVEIQAQYLESDPTAYRALVLAAAQQARRANPRIDVLAGLSTRYASDPAVLMDAWSAVSDVVDGHYLSVPDGIHPEIAAGFLHDLADQG
ncbi:MAG TPA: hypothetical protein VK646_10495 [Actinomycetota bacterium]|nr:hypothetical protein [Actinomycetota bacterium]